MAKQLLENHIESLDTSARLTQLKNLALQSMDSSAGLSYIDIQYARNETQEIDGCAS